MNIKQKNRQKKPRSKKVALNESRADTSVYLTSIDAKHPFYPGKEDFATQSLEFEEESIWNEAPFLGEMGQK